MSEREHLARNVRTIFMKAGWKPALRHGREGPDAIIVFSA